MRSDTYPFFRGLWGLMLLAALLLGQAASAQDDTRDIDEVDLTYSATGLPVFSAPGAGGGTYILAGGWSVVVTTVSASSMDVDITLAGTGVIASATLDNGGGLDSMSASTGGDEVWVYLGATWGETITVANTATHSLVFGMGGNDDISAGGGASGHIMVAFGGDGDDDIEGDGEADILFGDWTGGAWTGTDTIDGMSGVDRIFGGPDFNYLYGGDGADRIQGGDDGNYIEGNAAADLMYGGASQDTMYGGDGGDTMEGGGDGDTMYGENGPDNIWGDFAPMTPIVGGTAGDDTIYGGDSCDLIYCGPGDDYAEGNEEMDAVNGEAGVDTLKGGSEDDYLCDIDGVGGNWLYGDSEDDQIMIQDGNEVDHGRGGTGDDTVWMDWIPVGPPAVQDDWDAESGSNPAANLNFLPGTYTGADPFFSHAFSGAFWGTTRCT